MGLALVSVLWAYDGWGDLSFAAGEVRDPQKNLPRAIILGTLAIVDHDRVDLSNLQRQLLFDTASVGASKAASAQAGLDVREGPKHNIQLGFASQRLPELAEKAGFV